MRSKPEVTVGLSISLNGRFGPQGRQALQGIRLWQSYINAQGGIAVRNGAKRSVRLIWHDDHSQISGARTNVLKLLREDQVDILFGPYSSSLTNYGGTSDEIFRKFDCRARLPEQVRARCRTLLFANRGD